MKKVLTRRLVVGGLGASALAVPRSGKADATFPTRPIRLVVPFAAGGTTDVLARILSEKMRPLLGQPIVVDNRPGAGGNIGADFVAKSSPDGYTLLLATPGPLAINAKLFRSMPFNAERDLTGVGMMIRIQTVIIANAETPYRTLADVIADARAKGSLNYATAGLGTTPHLAAELLASKTGIKLQPILYRGDAPAINDLLGGHVGLMFANIAGVAGQLGDGKVRPIAVTGTRRSQQLPDVPTVAEAGVPGYEVTAWAGIAAPAVTPAAIIVRLNAAMNQVLDEPEVIGRIRNLSAEPVTGTPGDMNALMAAERITWWRIIEERSIRAE